MSFRKFIIAAVALGAGAIAALGQAGAADLPGKAAKKAPADLPFFLVVDNLWNYVFQVGRGGFLQVKLWSRNYL